MFALWVMMQAPIGMSSAAPPVTSPPREWNLAGAFTLKQENFLVWQSVMDPTHPYKGLHSEPRLVTTLELAPTHRRLKNFSLMLESLPAPASGGVGILRPKLQLRVAGTQIRVGVMQTTQAFRTWDARTGAPIGPVFGRAMGFVSGRF